MQRAGAHQLSAVLLEREAQLTQVANACERVAAGGGGQLVVVSGPAGIGKTAVLRAGCELAAERGFTVLRARGAQLEMEFAFGVVRQLIDRVLAGLPIADRVLVFDGAARLAEPLIASWLPTASARSLTERDAVESPFGVLHGLYWLLANLAERGPLMLAVDDAQWADAPSLRFLAYLTRRLEDVPVLAMAVARFAAETDASGALSELLHAGDPEILQLAPLTESAVTALVRAALSDDAAPAFCAACHSASAGNPFILGELLSELRADAIEPTAANAGRVARLHPAAVARTTLARLARLSAETRDVARAISVLGSSGDPRRVAELAGCEPRAAAIAALEALVANDFLTPDVPPEFVHPLVRAAIYEGIQPARRAFMHARAARLLAGEGVAAEVVAAHLLKCEPAGEAWAVETLRTAAASARARAAPELAMTYLCRARAEPPSTQQLSEILAELGMAAAAAQDPAAVDHLSDAAAAAEDAPMRCKLAMLLARQLMHRQRLGETVEMLQRAIDELARNERNRDLTLRLEAELIMMMHFDRSLHAAAWRRLDRFDLGAEPEGLGKVMLLSNLTARAVFVGEPLTSALELAERVVADWRMLVDQDAASALLAPALRTLVWCDRLELAEEIYAQVVTQAVEHGHAATWALMSAFRSECAFRRGNIADAEAYARQASAAAVAHRIGIAGAYGAAFLAQALVDRGQFDEAVDALGPWSTGEVPVHLAFTPVLYVRGLLRHAQGDLAGALEDLVACGERQLEWGCVNPAVMPWRSQAGLVCSTLGNHARARSLVAEELTLARRFGAPRAIAIALCAAGLVESGSRSLALLSKAVATLEGSSARLELARALVDYGTRLRHAGRRVEAREPLRRGLDLADGCGATVLASRAHDELITSGARPHRERLDGIAALTAGELRVARLAAQGLTNRQIAQQLFLSTKTIAIHLTHAYQKLNLKTRAELPRALAHADRM